MKKLKTNKTIIYVVRHGQAEFNEKGIIGGTLEPNLLTAKGENQAEKLANKLKNIQFDKIYSSDLRRAKQTAEIIAKSKDLPVITTTLVRERSWGSLQGKKFTDAQKGYTQKFSEEKIAEGQTALDFTFVDDMESLQSAITRFNTFVNMVVQTDQGNTILVVSHFDIMMGYLVFLRYGTYQDLLNAHFDHAGYYKLIYEKDKIFIDDVIGLRIKET